MTVAIPYRRVKRSYHYPASLHHHHFFTHTELVDQGQETGILMCTKPRI